MRSMTGFGTATAEGGGAAVTVEARSVNHRFLQVKVRVPAELGELEADLEALVRKRLVRGVVNLSVRVEALGAAAAARVNDAVVERYRGELERLALATGAGGCLTLAEWAALPGVLDTSAAELDAAGLARAARRAAADALDGLVSMREREGAATASDMARHARTLASLRNRIEKRAPQVVRRLQRDLRERVALLVGRADLDATELAREVALLADRADVAEELARLEAHLAVLADLLAETKDAVGRKLDFLVQEVFREVNTIGSKCSDARIAHWVVDAKTAVERLREQVQNVE